MKKTIAMRLVTGLGGTLALTTLLACPAPPEQGNPPDNGNIIVPTPPVDEQPDPDDIVEPENCNALVLTTGATFDCAELQSPTGYCDNLYPPDAPVNGAGINTPDPAGLQTVIDCAACDATLYGLAPQGAECAPGGGGGNGDNPLDDDGILEERCIDCHAPSGYGGQNSIEDPHPWAQQKCTTCHGGDPAATNPVYAHVCAPPAVGNRQQQVLDPRAFFLSFTTAGVQYLEDYYCTNQAGEQVLTSPEMWLNFINPSDLRSGRSGDLEGNPLGCTTCHAGTNDAVSRSVMGNATGLNSGSRFGIAADNKYADRRESNLANDWGTMADYGATAIDNPEYDAANRVVGEVPSLYQPEVFTGEGFQYDQTYTADAVNNSYELANLQAQDYPNGINNAIAEQLFQEVLNQACTGCHSQNAYNNSRAGDYRGTGCASCHFQRNTLGRSSSNDPNIDKYEPIDPNNLTPGEKSWATDHAIRSSAKSPGQLDGAGNVITRIVRGVSDVNCIVCHMGSNRTVAQYQGYRLDQNEDLQNNNFYPSQNTVTFTNRAQLFGENQNYNNRAITQWIDTEIWQVDANNDFEANVAQDETAEDVHHAAGMGCIDCHMPEGALHGNGKIMGRMKAQTHTSDVICSTCHGTIDEYAYNDGTNLLTQGDTKLQHTVVNDAIGGEFWLVSKVNGSLHYIPQVRDTVDATNAGGFEKVYPAGSPKAGQPLYNLVASSAMGRYQNNQDLSDGYGPVQNDPNVAVFLREGFAHSSPGGDYETANDNGGTGLECYSCHMSWQNNCIGCHLDAFYDNNPNNFFFSQVTGERIYFNFNANFVYQNPINTMLGLNDRGKISPYQGLHRFFSYTDINNNTSDRMAYSDGNGLGNDAQLRNENRNALPALENQPFTPHTMRNRYSATEVGMQTCQSCHVLNANQVLWTDQAANTYDVTDAYNDFYAADTIFQVQMQLGLGSNLWLFDANGDAVVDTNNAPAYDLDRIVEADGTQNTSSNHPRLDPFGVLENPDYGVNLQSTNGARVATPLTGTVLQGLAQLHNVGLSDVYIYNYDVAQDVNDTFAIGRAWKDFNYFQ